MNNVVVDPAMWLAAHPMITMAGCAVEILGAGWLVARISRVKK
jgi:hypothetical protein